jgi:glycosyltransferase involved in cell wall biosynthesis
MTQPMTGRSARPRFSIVTAVFDVEPYLPAFIDSIERQRVEPDELEVVAVDDGSTDGSLDLLGDWARRSRFTIKVFTKPNGGQGSARNLGLDHASGEWVTFPDPDDILEPDYLRVAARFATDHPAVEAMAGKPILYVESEDRLLDEHPRRWQYERGNRVADMTEEPNVFPGSSSVSFYRLERLREIGLRFDPQVRPNFEDGHFAVRYVLSLERPRAGLLRDARYRYRKRSAQTSTLQLALRDPHRYTTVLELGYLDVVAQARAASGAVPEWLQHVLIYELYWYLTEDEKPSSGAYLAPDRAPEFHDLLGRILRQLDPDVVRRHRVHRLSSVLADVFAHAGRPEPWHTPVVVRTRHDRDMGLRRVSYRFVGPPPDEAFSIDDETATPAYAKTMAHRYYGRDLLFTRIVWLPASGRLRVLLDGKPVRIRRHWPRVRSGASRPGRASRVSRRLSRYWQRSPAEAARVTLHRLRSTVRNAWGASLRRLAALEAYRTRFRDAWILMDRIHDADDNGERLYEHIRRNRPDINAWFVLERHTADWQRLRAAGETRLLAHGSLGWKMAMLNCRWLLSSHVDLPVYRPAQLASTGPATWKFAFLQHGVIKDDLSLWLNYRELDLFVVSTSDELASVVDDGTTYRFTAKETRNTGLPRFDRLLAKGQAVPEAERNLVIVAPTWRQWLTRPLARGSQRRTLKGSFWDSEYMQSWTALLRSKPIADAIAARGWRLGFMPHPNLQAILGELDLPEHVAPLTFAGVDVQGVYARCALLVTDYSSVVFNTAYLDRPAVYFQFDREEMLGGAHVGRQGYFDYERDGFGPVAVDLEAAERDVVAAIRRGARPTAAYQARIDATFPVRDGGACARVVAAVEELSRPYAGLPELAPAGPNREATG